MTPLSTAILRRDLKQILDRAEAGEMFLIVGNRGRSTKPGRARAVIGPVPEEVPDRTIADEIRDAEADFALVSQTAPAQRGIVTGMRTATEIPSSRPTAHEQDMVRVNTRAPTTRMDAVLATALCGCHSLPLATCPTLRDARDGVAIEISSEDFDRLFGRKP